MITNELGLIGDLGVEAGLASSDHGLVRWSIYVGSERRDDTISLRLAKVIKPTYRLHIGARVNAALLTYEGVYGL